MSRLLFMVVLAVVITLIIFAFIENRAVNPSSGNPFAIETVTVTAYSPSPHITDSTPFEMASGRVAKPSELEQLKFVAISRDLMGKHGIKYGDTIYIAFEVQDKMGPKAKNRVDVFWRSLDQARKFGSQEREIVLMKRR